MKQVNSTEKGMLVIQNWVLPDRNHCSVKSIFLILSNPPCQVEATSLLIPVSFVSGVRDLPSVQLARAAGNKCLIQIHQ
ncbi:hypothetical protein CEXT_713971 [Caerostris extrusa]|uniref:Uncharacterized protein n=1 Tax=Caerostris extrusa TaxID=172846 RepID=A0AAV4N6U9_CAEEX|nr:hypothetical protein CEXT_713971 [Caerostris extrusa]